MSGTGLGRASLSLLTIVSHRLHPFFLKWEEMVVEGATKKSPQWLSSKSQRRAPITKRSHLLSDPFNQHETIWIRKQPSLWSISSSVVVWFIWVFNKKVRRGIKLKCQIHSSSNKVEQRCESWSSDGKKNVQRKLEMLKTCFEMSLEFTFLSKVAPFSPEELRLFYFHASPSLW